MKNEKKNSKKRRTIVTLQNMFRNRKYFHNPVTRYITKFASKSCVMKQEGDRLGKDSFCKIVFYFGMDES